MFITSDFQKVSLVFYFTSWQFLDVAFSGPASNSMWWFCGMHSFWTSETSYVIVKSSELMQHINIDAHGCPKEKNKYPCKPAHRLAPPWNGAITRNLQKIRCRSQEWVQWAEVHCHRWDLGCTNEGLCLPGDFEALTSHAVGNRDSAAGNKTSNLLLFAGFA